MTSIRDRTISGAAWTSTQLVVTKAVSFGGQLALAAILSPADFGLFSIAMTTGVICMPLQTSGVRDVIIRRRASTPRISPSAYAVCMALAIPSCLLMLSTIPLLGALYSIEQHAQLAQLMIFLSLHPILAGIGIPSNAQLQSEFRFRELSVITAVSTSIDVAIRIGLAYLGFGALSFIIGLLVGTALQSISTIALAPPTPVLPRRIMSYWILRSSMWIVGGEIFLTALEFVDYAVLATITTETQVGIYFMAFTLSNQIVFIFAANIAKVLYASITGMRAGLEAKTRAQWRATRFVASWITPLSVLQITLAPTIIPLLLPPKWSGAIWLVQILAVGMTFRPHISLSMSFLKGNGRFTTRIWSSATMLATFTFAIVLGAISGGAVGVAICSSIYFAVTTPIVCKIACPDIRWSDVLQGVSAPAIPVLVTFAFACYLPSLILAVSSIPLTVATLIWIRHFFRQEWTQGLQIAAKLSGLNSLGLA